MLPDDFGSTSDRACRGTTQEKLWGLKAVQREEEEHDSLKSGEFSGSVTDMDRQRIFSWLQDDCSMPTTPRQVLPPCSAFPPQWLCKAPRVAGRVVKLAATPHAVFSAISSFLREGAVPGKVETVDAWTLRGVVFVDFCLVGVQIKIFSETLDQTAAAHFQHTSGGDILRFAQVLGLTMKNLESCDIRSDFQQNASLDDYWFGTDDFSNSELEAEPWPQRVKAVLETVCPDSPIASQEEAWRTLASWAATGPASCPTLAAALLAKLALVSSTFARASSTPVSVLYPMAAAIRFAAMAPDACLLADELLETLAALADLPSLVHRELALAIALLRGAGVENYGDFIATSTAGVVSSTSAISSTAKATAAALPLGCHREQARGPWHVLPVMCQLPARREGLHKSHFSGREWHCLDGPILQALADFTASAG
eukprot:CAMPEP_0177176502 /NCGR_PEP_ID=MMETSP0367-20130122/13284_1 /TAXON_ID=447022 ORGANISM="Scrippsiella hangoei-like, Strain SHHI-4" /NCGR_SAMPLE_ID=MMETSP0367 /ASSEMBLY_ACC=CAM_ASM_000362 /LENGTH=426 /DNA_ID=CAMNT_0018623007 /DNA_START=31 /DNA_END=1312 /DNA_ORIENTATION=+